MNQNRLERGEHIIGFSCVVGGPTWIDNDLLVFVEDAQGEIRKELLSKHHWNKNIITLYNSVLHIDGIFKHEIRRTYTKDRIKRYAKK